MKYIINRDSYRPTPLILTNSLISLSFTGSDSSSMSIDSNSRVLSFTSPPDYETENVLWYSHYHLTVLIPRLQSISVSIVNQMMNHPCLLPMVTLSKESDNSDPRLVGTLATTDADGDSLTYSMSGPGAGAFVRLNSTTGELTTVGQVDYEQQSSWSITAAASDGKPQPSNKLPS